MALNLKFNAKNGISVGLSSIPVIDNEGNATFNNLSATGTVNGLTISSTSVSFPTRSAQNVTQSITTNVSDEILVGNNASGKRVIFGGGAQNNFMNAAGMTTAGLVVGTIANATAGVSIFGGLIEQRNDASPQESRIYGTYSSSGANYERFFVKTNTGGATQIGLSAAGTGQNRNLEFVTGSSTRMTVTSGGDIGVGTSSPTAKFDVVGNGLFRSATTTDGATLKVTNGSTAQCTFGFGAGGNAFPGIWLNQPSPTFSNYAFLGSTADTFFNAPFNGFIYFRNNNSTRMMVDKSGVHIPGIPLVANPTTHQLTVSSTAPTKIGIVVQGATSQTADLQQWTDNSNTALAKINNVGDIEITNSTNGIILKSPDGTRYRITVTNGGALSSTDLTPPEPTTTPPPVTTTLPP
jgi:hypothetical protein